MIHRLVKGDENNCLTNTSLGFEDANQRPFMTILSNY